MYLPRIMFGNADTMEDAPTCQLAPPTSDEECGEPAVLLSEDDAGDEIALCRRCFDHRVSSVLQDYAWMHKRGIQP